MAQPKAGTRFVNVAFTPEQFALIERAAKANGLRPGQFVRTSSLAAAKEAK